MNSEPPPHSPRIIHANNLDILTTLPDESFQLIYTDPPFNTGKVQSLTPIKTISAEDGDRTGFQGAQYKTEKSETTLSYQDTFTDFPSFIRPRLLQAHRLLNETGTLYLHLDYREAHYCKVMLDEIFGRENFLNEIIWAFDYGAKSKKKWPTKHNTILVYVKDIKKYYFSSEDVDREPYMAPGLVTKEKAERGKLPTDVWWHTIVATNGSERTGYPTQKPEGIVRRMVTASSREGDRCLDFFAGSGTLGAVCRDLGRDYLLIDESLDAIEVMRKRLES